MRSLLHSSRTRGALGRLSLAIATSGLLALGPAAARAAEGTGWDKLDGHLREIYHDYMDHLASESGEPYSAADPLMPVHDGDVLIDATAVEDGALLLVDLEDLGLTHGSAYGRGASGMIPIVALEALRNLPSLLFAEVSLRGSSIGAVTTQGDAAQRSDDARAGFFLTGAGVTVGVMSDSLNQLGGLAADQASNDLPAVNILNDTGMCMPPPCTDEGRAMAQIVADVAPGANLAFRTAFLGAPDFANGITQLQAAGANVIVDDVTYFNELFFQDDQIAQSVNNAVAAGVAYFASAGNWGALSYQAPYRVSGLIGPGGNPAHDFDPTATTDIFQSITIPGNTGIVLTLQWPDPGARACVGCPGAVSDLDFFLTNAAGNTILAQSINANIGANPVEVLTFTNPNAVATQYNLSIELVAGPVPTFVKYVDYSNLTGTPGQLVTNEFATGGSTITPHANANGAGVAAADYRMTPEFGTSPPVAQGFTSLGGTPILFTIAGLPTNVLRAKPDFTGPDTGNNTFFGGDVEGDGFPNFSGTSAAAPHAAGLAALLLQNNSALTPAGVNAALAASAVDMNTPGFDFLTGAGLIQADLALGAVERRILDIDGDALAVPNFGAMDFLGVFRAPERLDLRSTTLAVTDLLNDDGMENVANLPIGFSPLPGATRDFAAYASLFVPGFTIQVFRTIFNNYVIDLETFNNSITPPQDCGPVFGIPQLRTSFILNDGSATPVVARTTEGWLCFGNLSLSTF